MERQRHALEEITEWRRGHEKGSVIVLSDNDEEATTSTPPVRSGDPGQGYSKDDGDPPSDGDDDYTNLCKLLGMN
ncbi:hypothetical protein D1007_20058 [Hordeum vulgare]|nr:hypothetical protein D1007_20058 [Hordeum vulgare]